VRAAAERHDRVNTDDEERTMSFEETMGTVSSMISATQSLAAIGAELSLKVSGAQVDPSVLAALKAVSAAAGLPDLDALAPEQQGMLSSIIRVMIRQADDLVSEPGRAPGWSTDDQVLTEGFGRASMGVPPMILAGAPELADVTSFLDVGTGIGLLAVAATNVWPSANVVGIDASDKVLERARANVAGAGRDDRITLRHQRVSALDDVETYDCAWVPTFFVSADELTAGVGRIPTALRPGGWIVLGRNEPGPNPVAQATTAVTTARNGGTDLDVKAATELLETTGFTAIRALDRTPAPIGFVIGQKPG